MEFDACFSSMLNQSHQDQSFLMWFMNDKSFTYRMLLLSGQNATDITRSSRGHGNYFEIETLDITSNTPNIKNRCKYVQVVCSSHSSEAKWWYKIWNKLNLEKELYALQCSMHSFFYFYLTALWRYLVMHTDSYTIWWTNKEGKQTLKFSIYLT